MNFKTNVLILSVFLMAAGAFASPQSELGQSSQDAEGSVEIDDSYAKSKGLTSCSEMNLKNEDLDAICKTADGGQFRKVEDGIQDVASGLIVNTEIKNVVDHYQATNYCSAKGQRLPTREEFRSLERRGFREAFNWDMIHDDFWSSSIRPGNDYWAYFLEGYGGGVGVYARDRREFNNSARCVSAAGAK